MFELILAKLAALGVGAKVAVATATAAGVVAAGAASGVVPSIPTDAPAAEQTVTTSDVEQELVEGGDLATGDVTTEEEGEPAEQATFGQETAADAQDDGVDGRAIVEDRSGRELPEQGTAGQANGTEAGTAGQAKGAEGRATGESKAAEGQSSSEQAPAGSAETGQTAAAEGADNGAGGQQTAEEAPAEGGPEGTPGEERAGERR